MPISAAKGSQAVKELFHGTYYASDREKFPSPFQRGKLLSSRKFGMQQKLAFERRASPRWRLIKMQLKIKLTSLLNLMQAQSKLMVKLGN